MNLFFIKGNSKGIIFNLHPFFKTRFSQPFSGSKWLADQLDRDRSTVSRWCTNDIQPTIETFYRIAEILDGCEDWEGLRSIAKVESERYIKSNGRTEKEARFYISSHKADARQINAAIRNHWSVENRLHWMLDVVFAEDSSRRRAGSSATNFNIISKIALGLIERSPYKKKSKRQRRFKAGFDPEFREKVLNL